MAMRYSANKTPEGSEDYAGEGQAMTIRPCR